ncbi:MAG: AMP-binding protein, partial [Actinomycetota bacterium]|nr:AMP-binding protein [Actinomycetota bacterium]
DLASVRVAVSAGEPLGVALAERARAFLGCPVLDGLGSTEVGQTFASNTLECWRDGSVGRALPPYRVSVRDDEGAEVAPGQVGSLWVAGPTLLLEYLGRPEATAAVRRGEWLRTGDRAEVDGDGFLHLRGRSDDVELVGGMCVSPLEIEAVLSAHPAVTEVAVAAIVGADGASRLHAFVVPAPGAPPGEVVAAELLALARAELAPFKVPRSVAFVDALPRTPTGKLRRFVLRQGGWADHHRGGAQPASAEAKRST